MSTITWLHLSDLHYCEPETGWDADEIIDKLLTDLKYMEKSYELKPDLIFFTGDLAFGNIKEDKGLNLIDQYTGVNKFLEKIRNAFKKEIPKENMFLVPGNHDVDRSVVTQPTTKWLDEEMDEKKVTEMIKQGRLDWKDCIRRLEYYKLFLEKYGFTHILTDKERLFYGITRKINGLKIGIGGFNSAWSCSRESKNERGKLWIGAKYQLSTIRTILKDMDFSIALIHHPPRWFVEREDQSFCIKLQENFKFSLHGHEHQEWINILGNHTTISAAACYDSSDGNNGYNFVRLDFEENSAEVWLRKYQSMTGGWIPCNIYGKTEDNGKWKLDNTQWMKLIQRPSEQYNIYISYNSNDKDWMQQHLYNPLLQCRTSNNICPNVFLGIAAEAIVNGELNFTEKPENKVKEESLKKLEKSRHVISVFTTSYFKDDHNTWEYSKILGASNKQKILHPIIAEPNGEFPPTVNTNHLNINNPNWFNELIKAIGLTLETEANPAKLIFISQPSNIIVNNTLPPIDIEIQDDKGIVSSEEEITISAEHVQLQGTKIVTTKHGKATFSDLSFVNTVASTRLIIEAKGLTSSFSQYFSVVTPVELKPLVKSITINYCGEEAFFFENSKSIAIFNKSEIGIYSLTNDFEIRKISFPGRIRLKTRKDSVMAIADWSGNAAIIYDDGNFFIYKLESKGIGFNIPGDITIFDGNAYIGFWNGSIYKLSPGNEPFLELVHTEGIQCLQVLQDGFYICDLNGNFCVYRQKKLVQTHQLESTIFSLKNFQNCLIAVGEKKLYQYAFADSKVNDENTNLIRISAVLDNKKYFIVVDPQGKGLCFDRDLVIRSRFYTREGAFPISSDDRGEFYIFQYPEYARVLMVNEKIVHTHSSGPLSVAPRCDYFAIGGQNETEVIEASKISTLYEVKESRKVDA